jgi:hypothetical protein
MISMARKIENAAVLAALLLGVPAIGQNPQGPPSALPVKQVTLFTSGVSYTERSGDVDGDASVPLLFRTAQINDILKSLVLLDSNGKVQPATYTARDPIGRTLQSFAVDVTENLSLEQLLAQLRGAQVTVETPGKPAVTGRIVGVEIREVPIDDKKSAPVPFMTILGEAGLTTVRLDGEKSIKFLDARLNREFTSALELLASGSDDQRRQVTLHFSGNGKREVRVGYVTEAPLWKMSYRLLVGGADQKAGAGKSYLQGFALVENTTDDDWKDIRLSLVSGRPVSFIQDLYQPLYIPRPVVAPDVIASIFPQTHGGGLDDSRKAMAKVPMLADLPLVGNLFRDKDGATRRSGAERPNADSGLRGPAGPAGEPAPSTPAGGFGGGRGFSAEEMKQSLQSQAAGQSAGELFQYNITSPVSLPRQQAAMIPVVAQDIDTEKVSLFNADSGAKYPLNAVRVKNNTGLHLKGGPVTLFDEGVYAGDAKMEDIPPADNRLVSYAVDLTVEGERQGPIGNATETSFSLKRGVLIIGRKEKQETTYTLKSRAQKAKTLLVEHPFNAEFKLVEPAKATERSATHYRFAVELPAGESKKLQVVTERQIAETIGILDSDINMLTFHANRKQVPQKIREALQEVLARRRKVQELQGQAASREQEIGAIMQDQERIRKNMAALDKASALYKRYVSELDRQETKIQNLREEAARLRREAGAADTELRRFLDDLSISG